MKMFKVKLASEKTSQLEDAELLTLPLVGDTICLPRGEVTVIERQFSPGNDYVRLIVEEKSQYNLDSL